MYQKLVSQEEKISQIKDISKWSYTIGEYPIFRINAGDIEDPIGVLRKAYHFDFRVRGNEKDQTEVTVEPNIFIEKDAEDKNNQIIVIEYSDPVFRKVATFLLLMNQIKLKVQLRHFYLDYVYEKVIMDISNWRVHNKRDLRCEISLWGWQITKNELIDFLCKKNCLSILKWKMDLPSLGNMYLDDNVTHIIWHSCPICDKPPTFWNSCKRRCYG
jgi:hypothetical protein